MFGIIVGVLLLVCGAKMVIDGIKDVFGKKD